jgi:hypothetical protein
MKTLEERLLVLVGEPDENGCLPWLGYVGPDGYGRISIGGRGSSPRRAHRVVWEIAKGAIPEGLFLDHVYARGCRRRDCVNVDHLEPVTNRENTMRGFAPNVLLHKAGVCANGHPARSSTRADGRVGVCNVCRRERRNNPLKKLTDEQVRAIRVAFIPKVNAVELARQYGVSVNYVRQLARGDYRKSVA